MKRLILTLILLLFLTGSAKCQNYYFTNSGYISFESEASEELISAESDALRTLIDIDRRTFVFKVSLRSFKGFNSSIQQEHFNEKYLETEKYPEALFTGKIIEDVDFTRDTTYEVRAKGIINIHGVEQERIIKGTLKTKDKTISIDSKFLVLLAEHNIKVPKVVHEKIATQILVHVKADLRKK